MDNYYIPALRSLASLAINFSAAWFGLAFFTPNYIELDTIKAAIVLIFDMVSGTLFLISSIKLEALIAYE